MAETRESGPGFDPSTYDLVYQGAEAVRRMRCRMLGVLCM